MDGVVNFISELDTTDTIIISAIALSLLIIAILIIILFIKEKRNKTKEVPFVPEDTSDLVVPEVETYVKKEVATPVKIEKTEQPDIIATMASRIEEKMEEEPENKVQKYEDDQEEESIISYQELIAKKAQVEPKPVSTNLQNIIEELRPKKEENMTIFDLEEKKQEEAPKPISNFKNEPFVSPVFGIQKGEITYPKSTSKEEVINDYKEELKKEVKPIIEEKKEENISLEKTLDLKPISDEIKRSDSFLDSLKELRKNLD